MAWAPRVDSKHGDMGRGGAVSSWEQMSIYHLRLATVLHRLRPGHGGVLDYSERKERVLIGDAEL